MESWDYVTAPWFCVLVAMTNGHLFLGVAFLGMAIYFWEGSQFTLKWRRLWTETFLDVPILIL
jgi:hypothetical protein